MLKPCHNRVLIQQITRSDSTIIRPSTADAMPFERWTVLAIGPDVKMKIEDPYDPAIGPSFSYLKEGNIVILIPGANVLPLPDFDKNHIGLVTDVSIVMVEVADEKATV